MTSTTYRAVQVTAPGRLELVERELVAPSPGKVRIRIEACGVCHTDAFTVEGLAPVSPTRAYPAMKWSAGSTLWARAFPTGNSASGWVWAFSAGIAAAAHPAGAATS